MLTLCLIVQQKIIFKEKFQSEGVSIEDFLKEMLQFYDANEITENIELNKIADERLKNPCVASASIGKNRYKITNAV